MTPAILAQTADASLSRLVAEGLDQVADRLTEHMRSGVPAAQALVEHAGAYRGKMVRPTMTILSGLAGGDLGSAPSALPDRLITIAAVVEMIHLATLVHDDVLDEAELRRGSPTICALQGNEAAVMLGDYLIARSFHLCSTLDDQRLALRIGEVTSRVCEGEVLQLAHRGDWTLSEGVFLDIIERKTAALIAVGCELGAVVCGAEADAAHALSRAGMRVGMAFQIQDDLLDLLGHEPVVGKPVGRDAEKGKPTLAVIHYLGAQQGEARQEAVEALEAGRGGALAARLVEAGSVDYARGVAESLIDGAKAELRALPPSPAKDQLLALAGAVVQRDR